MTLKQIERLKKKIADIRRALAAEKKKFGCYDDSRGIRYSPPKYYLQLRDYPGGLSYMKWFDKNFPDDAGFPIFLFEWTIILFKTGKTKEAEKKALQAFMSGTYIFENFLKKDSSSVTKAFPYSRNEPELNNFVEWLLDFVPSDKFHKISHEFVEIEKRLITEPVGSERIRLVNKLYTLLDSYD